MVWPWLLVGLLALVVAVLTLKILDLKTALRKLTHSLREQLHTDTNTLLTTSTRDRTFCALVSSLNRELRTLRQLRWTYESGSVRLRDSVMNLSHDLRTPLTSLCGYLERLQMQPHTEISKGYLTILTNRSEAMKRLIEELFDYSQLLSDNRKDKETLCVKALLEETIASFYPQLTQAKIMPVIDLPDGRFLRLLNRSDLARVFSNLLSNAIKYSDGDLTVRMDKSGSIFFSNHASSLDSVQVGRLFDRYYTVNTAEKSTGLGLSISRTLLEQMGGRIEAHYDEGQLFIMLQLPRA